MYFITCFEYIKMDRKDFPEIPNLGDAYTVGFKENIEEAMAAVENNVCDIHDGCYRYAVIEEMTAGIYCDVIERWFYKYNSKTEKFEEIDEPFELKDYPQIVFIYHS